MKLTLSHGPWSVAVSSAGSTQMNVQPHYTLSESVSMDSTYRWDWKGQALAGMTPCSFSYSSLEQHSSEGLYMPVVWSTSTRQRTWDAGVIANGENVQTGHTPIELTARYFWASEPLDGPVIDDWQAGEKARVAARHTKAGDLSL